MNHHKSIIIAFIYSASVFLCGCANISVASEIKDISIAHQGLSNRPTDEDFVKMCKEFTLKKSDIKQYFTNAKQITRSILHDKYELYPCYSDGKATLNKKQVTWRIHAGGIGFIRFENTEQVYACDENTCRNIKGLY